ARKNSTCKTACARSAATCGRGLPTARMSMSAATPNAWRRTSSARWSTSWRSTVRAPPTRRLRSWRSSRSRAAISRTSTDAGPGQEGRARGMNAHAQAPTVRTTCPYCGVGCGVLARPDGRGGARTVGDPDHPANFGKLCSKGFALEETLGLDGRLLDPMLRRADGSYARVDWDT